MVAQRSYDGKAASRISRKLAIGGEVVVLITHRLTAPNKCERWF